MNLKKWVVSTQSQSFADNTANAGTAVPGSVPDLVPGSEQGPVWQGFGGCFNELGGKALFVLDEAEQQKLLKLLFSASEGCGFVRNRMPVGANDYAESWYSLDETEDDFELSCFSVERDEKVLIPYIKAALRYAPEMKIFASPWSPPVWMKYPKAYNYGTLIKDDRYQKTYARYLLRFVTEMQKRGIPVTELHVQNEVQADQKFPSCLWSGEELRIFIRDYLGPEFEAAGFPADIWLGTINGPWPEKFADSFHFFANAVLLDPEARRFVKGIGYQWGGRYELQRTRSVWPDMPIRQTENECGNGKNDWKYAMYVFDLLWFYLTNDVEAYCYWNMILEDNKGRSTWGWEQNSMITINRDKKSYTLNPEFYLMSHFSRFIRPGARRLVLTGPWSGNAVAYRNSGDSVAAVIMNPYPENKTVQIKDNVFQLPPESFSSILWQDK